MMSCTVPTCKSKIRYRTITGIFGLVNMKYTIHRVKHSRYTHVVITHDLCEVDELIWNLAIPTGMILLDMKSCSQKILARFWEVKSEDNMLYWWRLRVVDQRPWGKT